MMLDFLRLDLHMLDLPMLMLEVPSGDVSPPPHGADDAQRLRI